MQVKFHCFIFEVAFSAPLKEKDLRAISTELREDFQLLIAQFER